MHDKKPTPLQTVLGQNVSRQEFLLLVGAGIAAIFGISSIIHFLTGKRPGSSSSWRSQGYGGGGYGE